MAFGRFVRVRSGWIRTMSNGTLQSIPLFIGETTLVRKGKGIADKHRPTFSFRRNRLVHRYTREEPTSTLDYLEQRLLWKARTSSWVALLPSLAETIAFIHTTAPLRHTEYQGDYRSISGAWQLICLAPSLMPGALLCNRTSSSR